MASRERARVPSLLDEGRLDRAVRVIEHSDSLCPEEAKDSRLELLKALVALGRDEEATSVLKLIEATSESAVTLAEIERLRSIVTERGSQHSVPDPESFFRLGERAKIAGHEAEAQRFFDRSLVDLERASALATRGAAEPLRLDVPNGLVGPILGVAWGDASARQLAIAHGGNFSTYDTNSYQLRRRVALDGVRGLASSPDGSFFAVLRYSRDATPSSAIELRDGITLALLHSVPLEIPFATHASLSFSKDAWVLTADTAGGSRRWQMTTMAELPSTHLNEPVRPIPDPVSQAKAPGPAPCRSSVTTARSDGVLVAVACDDGRIFISNAKSGERIHALTPHSADVLSVGFEPGTDHFLSGSGDGAARVWDQQTGRVLSSIETMGGIATGWSPNARVALGGCGDSSSQADSEARFCLWDRTGKLLTSLKHFDISPNAPGGIGWRFSTDGRVIAILSVVGLELWDVGQGRLVRTLKQWSCDRDKEWCNLPISFEAAPDGSVWALSPDNLEHWTADGQSLLAVPNSTDPTRPWAGFALSPDGRRFARGNGWTLEVFDQANHLAAAWEPNGVPIAFWPGGERILVQGSGQLTATDITSTKEVFSLPHVDLANAVSFSPNRDEMLIAYQAGGREPSHHALHSRGGAMRLWSSTTGRPIATIRAINGTNDSYVMTEGPDARIEFFGDAGRKHAFCRSGAITLPFDACAERFEVKDLLEKQRKGDVSYLDP